MNNKTYYSYLTTQFGIMEIVCTDDALIRLNFVSKQERMKNENAMTQKVCEQLQEYCTGKRKNFDIPLEQKGTAFQRSVWAALCEIPYGETRSYGDIATNIGNPKACRAVGMANHNNPIAVIVPCHRVIGKNGGLTGYAGGLEIKAALLEFERSML